MFLHIKLAWVKCERRFSIELIAAFKATVTKDRVVLTNIFRRIRGLFLHVKPFNPSLFYMSKTKDKYQFFSARALS